MDPFLRKAREVQQPPLEGATHGSDNKMPQH